MNHLAVVYWTKILVDGGVPLGMAQARAVECLVGDTAIHPDGQVIAERIIRESI